MAEATPKVAPTPIDNPQGPWAVVLATGALNDINTTLPVIQDGFPSKGEAETWIKTNYPAMRPRSVVASCKRSST